MSKCPYSPLNVHQAGSTL